MSKAFCFVIMPLTTPEHLVPVYANDKDHFSHVLNHLFVPAIKAAGFEPIPPIAQGADVIHAEIIKNLETADLVMCDISALNPNVFFELGCRTALNKPVCYVLDDQTRGIPFDTSIINHHTYSHALAPWTLTTEIDRLTEHIRASAERSAGKNMLWQYFGLRSAAHPPESGGADQDRLDYLVMQVEAIKQQMERNEPFVPGIPLNSAYVGSLQPYMTTYPITIKSGPLDYFPRDWNKEFEGAESDLNEIVRLKKSGGPPEIGVIRDYIKKNIRILGELISSEPGSELAAKARDLQQQYRDLLSGKQAK
ncbi:MAG: hypothetical protein HY046_07515 [Acidobacteria bacterium]|nr:hypothetical protein [Acidobacteriota bacterium]